MCLDNSSVSSLTTTSMVKLDSRKVKLFFSIEKCVQYLRSKGYPATQYNIGLKYIDTGISYYGYIFKYI